MHLEDCQDGEIWTPNVALALTVWLDHQHPDDLETYAATKREAAQASREAGETMMEYNSRKEKVIQEILNRAFRARGLLN